jgi:hypothetical protein
MTPWGPDTSDGNSNGNGGPHPTAYRVFDYIYKKKGRIHVESKSTLKQRLTLFEGGKLLMEGVQKMPQLPCKCWVVTLVSRILLAYIGWRHVH